MINNIIKMKESPEKLRGLNKGRKINPNISLEEHFILFSLLLLFNEDLQYLNSRFQNSQVYTIFIFLQCKLVHYTKILLNCNLLQKFILIRNDVNFTT